MAPLGIPEYRCFFATRSLADVAAFAFRAALTWYVAEGSGVAVSLGHVLMVMTLPQALFWLFGGAIGDRYGRKPTIVFCDVVSFAALAFLWLFASAGLLTPLLLLALAFLIGASSSLLGPSASTIIPLIVPKEQLQTANSLRFSATQAAGMVVPTIAGVLLTVTRPEGVFLFAAVCFLLSAMAFASAHIPQGSVQPRHRGLMLDLANGFKITFARRWLALGVSASVLLNFLIVAPQSALVPLLVTRSGLGPEVLGIQVSAFSIGVLCGTAMSARIPQRWAHAAVLLSIGAVSSVSILYMLPPTWWSIPLIACLVGVALGVFEVTWTTTLQERVEPDVLSRVYAVQASLSFASRAASLALVGFAMNSVPAAWLMGSFAAFTLVLVSVVALLGRSRSSRDVAQKVV